MYVTMCVCFSQANTDPCVVRTRVTRAYYATSMGLGEAENARVAVLHTYLHLLL